MIRHRSGQPAVSSGGDASSSDDEDDAFAALSRRKAKNKRGVAVNKRPTVSVAVAPLAGAAKPLAQDSPAVQSNFNTNDNNVASAESSVDAQSAATSKSLTSSMKRHHGVISDSRKAKMDALLQELEEEKRRKVGDSVTAAAGLAPSRPAFVPEKKGSFVEPGEEHLTTNIFVGNLAPNITEEELTDVFRQFGDLYSVKIMWPRTAEERARGRHTGFVCFMNRPDAEDAMEACDDADPFNVGRRIMLRWGKNVKKIVKKGAGGIDIAPIRKRARMENEKETEDKRKSAASDDSSNDELAAAEQASQVPYDETVHGSTAIRIIPPKDPRRLQFISTVASFVAKDGSALENTIRVREAANPKFRFLAAPAHDGDDNEEQRQEHIFYKWRVYAFCQGDGFFTWRTEPFVMFHPDGCFWIPPTMDHEAARREEELERQKEEVIQKQKQQRRYKSATRDYCTGRRLEQARKGAPDGGSDLSPAEWMEFQTLFRDRLCASREAICQAMAFCFEKSAAARTISAKLKELLLEDGPAIGIETRIARLYLLSDILFNSQQPGVRNAFLYRSAIEVMAPEIFTSLGKHGDGSAGRLTMNKLATAVSMVLSAWTTWSVFDPSFLDELHARFEGRELVQKKLTVECKEEGDEKQIQTADTDDRKSPPPTESHKPRGDWKTVSVHDDIEALDAEGPSNSEVIDGTDDDVLNRQDGIKMEDIDGDPVEDDDVDGVPVDEENDGVVLNDNQNVDPDDDPDGAPLEVGDIDGVPFDGTEGIHLTDAVALDTTNAGAGAGAGTTLTKDNIVSFSVAGGTGDTIDDDADGAPLDDDDDADGAPLDDDDIYEPA